MRNVDNLFFEGILRFVAGRSIFTIQNWKKLNFIAKEEYLWYYAYKM